MNRNGADCRDTLARGDAASLSATDRARLCPWDWDSTVFSAGSLRDLFNFPKPAKRSRIAARSLKAVGYGGYNFCKRSGSPFEGSPPLSARSAKAAEFASSRRVCKAASNDALRVTETISSWFWDVPFAPTRAVGRVASDGWANNARSKLARAAVTAFTAHPPWKNPGHITLFDSCPRPSHRRASTSKPWI